MADGKNETVLTVGADNTAACNKISQVSAVQRAEAGAADYVPHVTVGQVKIMALVASCARTSLSLNHARTAKHLSVNYAVSESSSHQVIDIIYLKVYNQNMNKRFDLPVLKCLRCRHTWYPKRPIEPKVCPKCKSPYWNKPKWKGV